MRFIKSLFCLHQWDKAENNLIYCSNQYKILYNIYGETREYWFCKKCNKIIAQNIHNTPISYVSADKAVL